MSESKEQESLFPPGALADKRPGEMGVWAEDNSAIWLERDLYPKRSQAMRWAMDQWQCSWLDVRCLSRWMVYTPRIVDAVILGELVYPTYVDDLWSECEKEEPNAFQVWRLECQ